MFGESEDTCFTCGTGYIVGCVTNGECPSCESKRLTLETAGWKLKQGMLSGLPEVTWEDPKFPGTVCPQSQALLIQEGRTMEEIKKLLK